MAHADDVSDKAFACTNCKSAWWYPFYRIESQITCPMCKGPMVQIGRKSELAEESIIGPAVPPLQEYPAVANGPHHQK